MKQFPIVRVARPTDRLDEVVRFYSIGLGLSVLAEFRDHNGFDGVIMGHFRAPYHFEFTHAHGHHAGRAPTQDNLVVFYLPRNEEWEEAVQRMREIGIEPSPSFNPYWDRQGVTFEDPDGYRVVPQRADWSL